MNTVYEHICKSHRKNIYRDCSMRFLIFFFLEKLQRRLWFWTKNYFDIFRIFPRIFDTFVLFWTMTPGASVRIIKRNAEKALNIFGETKFCVMKPSTEIHFASWNLTQRFMNDDREIHGKPGNSWTWARDLLRVISFGAAEIYCTPWIKTRRLTLRIKPGSDIQSKSNSMFMPMPGVQFVPMSVSPPVSMSMSTTIFMFMNMKMITYEHDNMITW